MDNNSFDILLVEDNPNDAELIIRALARAEITNKLIHLEDGAEALDFIFAEGKYDSRNKTVLPKLLMLDLKLPRVTGLEVLEALRKKEETKLLPVVIVTSSMEDRDVQKAYSLGVNSFIVKPVDFSKFIQTIKMVGNYWLNVNHQLQ